MLDFSLSLLTKKGRDGKLTNYQVKFTDRATKQTWRKSLRTKSKDVARRKIGEMERGIAHGTFNPYADAVTRDGVTLAQAFDDFMRAKKREGLRPKSLDNYASICGRFVKTMHATAQPGSVRPEHVERFVSMNARDGGKLSATSQATYLRNLRVFFRWLKAQGLLQVVPEVKRSGRAAKAGQSVPVFLSPDDYAKLLRGIEAYAVQQGKPGTRDVLWIADVVRVAAGTGMRRGELCRLRWADVNLKAETLTVRSRPGEETKSGHERTVPLLGDALTTLQRLSDARTSEDDDAPVLQAARGGQMDPNRVSKQFRRFRKAAGLPDEIHLHSLRHTFASWWMGEGGSLYKLSRALGHADIKQTQIYAHLHPEAAADEARATVGAVFERLNGPEAPADAQDDADAGLSEEARENARLRAENERLRAEVERLRSLIDNGSAAGVASGDGAPSPPSLTLAPTPARTRSGA